jgi:hypothetical protein
MPKVVKPAATTHTRPSSFLSLLTGWMQQGVESFFATQRILVDVAMRQNTMALKSLQEAFSDPEHSPVAILTELAVEGTSSFMEAQRILLNLVQQENALAMNAVKERVSGSTRAMAMTDMLRRSIDTFLGMQHEFLKTTSKQTTAWLEDLRHGKGYQATRLVDLAREGMDAFVEAQKRFLDVIAQETGKIASGKPEHAEKLKKTEMSKLAREAVESFIAAQKKLLDVVGQQMNVNLKAATKTMEMLSPARLMPVANVTGEGVRNFVTAEKAVIESMIRPAKAAAAPKRPPRPRKARRARPKAVAATA